MRSFSVVRIKRWTQRHDSGSRGFRAAGAVVQARRSSRDSASTARSAGRPPRPSRRDAARAADAQEGAFPAVDFRSVQPARGEAGP